MCLFRRIYSSKLKLIILKKIRLGDNFPTLI
nr:MAG TPA: hypothetical protein [Caudoviricetes sp.]